MKKTFLSLPFLYGLVLLVKAPGVAYAQFTMNFQPLGDLSESNAILQPAPGDCNRGDNPAPCNTEAVGYLANEPTPFFMENVEIEVSPGEFVEFVHYVVGDPAQGFAQEMYIRGNVVGGLSLSRSSSTFAAPFATAQNDPINGGVASGPLTERVQVLDPDTGAPMVDPETGRFITTDLTNGRGNPTRMVMRQVLGGEWDGENLSCDGSEFCMEFLKDSELTKPLIRQRIESGVVTADFSIDMREISYDDIDTAAPIVNRVTFNEEIPGEFDMATDIQLSTVTGGRYTYLPGGGEDGSLGTYEYWDGGFNMENIKWETYRDPFINPEINLKPPENEF